MNSNTAEKSAPMTTEPQNSEPSNPTPPVAPVKPTKTPRSKGKDAPLSDKQKELLTECETDIQKNEQGIFVLGCRLEQIRVQKLYRATHSTFAKYCRKRWDYSKTYANRLIQAHLCENNLKSTKNVDVYRPTKESQVRWICDLKPEQQVEVAAKVKETVGDGEASAGDFWEAREALYPKPKPAVKPAKPQIVDADDKIGKEAAPVIFDTKLVSPQELLDSIDHIYNIYINPVKKQEGLDLFGKVKRGLAGWIEWHAKQLTQKGAA